MSEVAATARRLAGDLLPTERSAVPPSVPEIESALETLSALHPVDAHDEMALHEAGETLLRLLESSRMH